MDCEKFDQHVIDALYDELDELTHAALKRHVEGCGRCAGVWAGLRATREVGILPIEEPSDDLEARILDAVAVAQQRAPWHKKVLRGLAWAGSHAMRPQLAMAAIFFLVIGSSLLLLRARPGTIGPVSVTERGSPAPEPAELAAANAGASRAVDAPAPPAATPAESTPERGPVPQALVFKDREDARASLAEARALRDRAGCAATVLKLDAIAVSFPGTQLAADAMWDEASCYQQMGEAQKAQQIYQALRSTGYRDRAEQQLAAGEVNAKNQMAAPAAAAPSPMAAARAAPAAKAEGAYDSPAAGAPASSRAMKSPAAGAPDSRAPAAPAPRSSHNVGFGP
jgi:hypothetical protein